MYASGRGRFALPGTGRNSDLRPSELDAFGDFDLAMAPSAPEFATDSYLPGLACAPPDRAF
jgi:hypothetical protein